MPEVLGALDAELGAYEGMCGLTVEVVGDLFGACEGRDRCTRGTEQAPQAPEAPEAR